jgi:signal transduction histidine kinase
MLATSILPAVFIALSGILAQRQLLREQTRGLERETELSLATCQAIWRERSERVARDSLLLSAMSDVRAAFGTADPLTIRDAAGEFWQRVAPPGSVLFVLNPEGQVVAHAGILSPSQKIPSERLLQSIRQTGQTEILAWIGDRLFYLVATPVTVEGATGSVLLSTLLAGYPITDEAMAAMPHATATPSNYVAVFEGRSVASTLQPGAAALLATQTHGLSAGQTLRIAIAGEEYLVMGGLLAPNATTAGGRLLVLRSLSQTLAASRKLFWQMAAIWLAGTIGALALSLFLAKRIIRPVLQLSDAATAVASGNYDTAVPVADDDEIGNLGRSFNAMCSAIRATQARLVQQERLGMIGRLMSGIVHDLRNPLAAIIGGAELMATGTLDSAQMKRLSTNLGDSARTIEKLLEDLLETSRQREEKATGQNLAELVSSVVATIPPKPTVVVNIPGHFDVLVPPFRIERALMNVLRNAVEASQDSGEIHVWAERRENRVALFVDDSGPGISPAIRSSLFQPFVTSGKAKGLGLGLALSREILLQAGGDLTLEDKPGLGARFVLWLRPRE